MNRDPSLEFLLIELLVFLTTGLIGLVLLKSSVHSNCLNSPNCHVPSVLLQTR